MQRHLRKIEVLTRVRVAHLTNSHGILAELRSIYRAARRDGR